MNRLHLVAAGDIYQSVGSRSFLRGLLGELRRHRIEVHCSFFQFRLDGMPAASEEGLIEVPNFPDPVYCPVPLNAFIGWPRPIIRFYERLLLYGYLRKCLREVRPEDRLILHGCLGALHLWPRRLPGSRKWWLKLGLIEEQGMSGLRYRWRKWVESLHARRFDRRLLVSEPMASFLKQEYGPSREGYFVLPCLVDMEYFHPADHRREEARRQLEVEDRFVLLYMGSADRWQCPRETVAFFRRLRMRLPAYFWVLSPSQDYFRTILNDLPETNWRVECRPYKDLSALLLAADAGCLLRPKGLINRVSSPVKFPEYLACGLPVVIGPEVGVYSDLVREHGVGVVVDPDRPDDWDRAIDTLLAITRSKDSVRERCLQAAQTFSWQAYRTRIRDEFIGESESSQ